MLRKIFLISILSFWLASAAAFGQMTRFAVIGDYGDAGKDTEAIAGLVKSWKPDFIITVGDNNYPDGEASTIDRNVGQYFHEYIYNYKGKYGEGSADVQRFFPSLGNHDYHTDSAQAYLDYFTLPGNERYYDFIRGDVHFFALDSNPATPDGVSENETQAQWLKNALAASTKTWKIVYFHHPPYSSGKHGSSKYMRWNFKEWGATAVISGHDHIYERLHVNNFPYIINGLGGVSAYGFEKVSVSSRFRYNEQFGAMRVEAYPNLIQFQFFNRYGIPIDTLVLQALAAPASLSAISVTETSVKVAWLDLSSAEQGFRVEKSTDGESYIPAATVKPNENDALIEELEPETRYYFRVKAFRNDDESLYSNTIVVSTPMKEKAPQ